jgi:UDP-GlcNAc3NAcA epimerase
LQKEACFFKKFCITMRDQTEWTELVQNGVNILTGANSDKIIAAVRHFSQTTFPDLKNIYGNGNASFEIYSKIAMAAGL